MGLLFAFPALSFGQTGAVPQGGEYSVTGALPGDQARPALALGAAGGFVVWEDNLTDPSGLGISARKMDATRSFVGEPFRINQTLGNDQQNARISLLSDGGAVIVWEGIKTGSHNVYARFLRADGTFATDEIVVNQPAGQFINRYTTNWTLIRNNKARTRKQNIRETVKSRHEFNSNPNVALLNDGSVIVVYSSSRKLSVKSVGLSEQLRWDDKRSTFITNRTRVPIDERLDYMQDVYVQRLSAAGEKIGGEIVVNSTRDYNQRNGTAAVLANGRFVVCWVNELPGSPSRVSTGDAAGHQGGQVNIHARVFGADGTPAGPAFRVDASASPCGAPTITAKANGGFTVAWVQRDIQRQNGLDVWFRSFDTSATAQGEPVRVNSQTFGDQFAPSIATVGGHQFLAWSSMGQDGSWEGVFARVLQDNSFTGAEFRVNTKAYLRQIDPFVCGSGTEATVVWSTYTFGSAQDLVAQRYQVP